MTKMPFFPSTFITAAIFCLSISHAMTFASEQADASQGSSSDTVVEKVEKTAVRAATATKKGIKHAAEATERGIKRGTQAVAKGVEHGRRAVSRTAGHIAEKVSPTQAPAPVTTPGKAD